MCREFSLTLPGLELPKNLKRLGLVCARVVIPMELTPCQPFQVYSTLQSCESFKDYPSHVQKQLCKVGWYQRWGLARSCICLQILHHQDLWPNCDSSIIQLFPQNLPGLETTILSRYHTVVMETITTICLYVNLWLSADGSWFSACSPSKFVQTAVYTRVPSNHSFWVYTSRPEE